MLVIGLIGKKRVGKDLSAKFLKLILEPYYDVDIISIADGVKRQVSKMYDLSMKELEDLKNDETKYIKSGKTARQTLQDFGSFIRDINGDDYWISETIKKMNKQRINVITDVRFMNENQILKDTFPKFISIKLIRNTNLKEDNHPSEKESEQIACDFEIINNGSKGQLFRELQTIVELVYFK